MPGRVITLGTGAPTRIQLPKTFTDDTVDTTSKTSTTTTTTRFRLTLAKEFAPDLFERASKRPQSLPSIILKDNAKHVLRVLRADAYPLEVTALISVRTDHAATLEGLQLARGTWALKHYDQSAQTPQFLTRPGGMTTDDYWNHAHTTATTTGGRVIYRSTQRDNLGIIGGSRCIDNVVIPRWFLDAAPKEWTSNELETWATARGFSKLADCTRLGGKRWSFRGLPPTDKADATETFTFTSGITVSKAQRTSHTPKAKTSAHSCWGAPSDLRPPRQSNINLIDSQPITVPSQTPPKENIDMDTADATKRAPETGQERAACKIGVEIIRTSFLFHQSPQD